MNLPPTVVVASVEVPDTATVPVATRLVVVALLATKLVVVKLVKNAETALKRVAKRLLLVVVARVLVPVTTKLLVVVLLLIIAFDIVLVPATKLVAVAKRKSELVADPPGTNTVMVPDALVAETPPPTKLNLRTLPVSAPPSSSAPSTPGKQLASAGPQGSMSSAPGSRVWPSTNGLVRGAAKVCSAEMARARSSTKRLAVYFILFMII